MVPLNRGAFNGRGPFLVMVVADAAGMHVIGVDGSMYDSGDFGRFIASWSNAVDTVQARFGRSPGSPGVVRSMLDLVSAVLRAAFGGVAGLIQGVVSGL